MEARHDITVFFILAGSIFATDQLIKYHIEKRPSESFPVTLRNVPATLYRSHNRGLFMNRLENHPKIAACLSSGALGLFSFLYLPAMWKKCSLLYMTGAALTTGGALSNICDRFRKGFVTDYFSLSLKPVRHIVFNLGDFSIFAGLSALICDQFYLG